MRFLEAEKVVLVGLPFEVLFASVPWRLEKPEKPSRSPRHAAKASYRNVDTCIPHLLALEDFTWL